MPPFKEWDDPEFIVRESIKAQHRLLSGFHGTKGVNKKKLREAYEPNQAAISLIGEPTLYPKIDELVEEFKKRNFTTFLVTNGTNPKAIEESQPYQLYISITAWDEESHKKLQNGNLWGNIEKSLEIMAEKDCRTVIRLTLMRGINMEARKFLRIVNKAKPDFIEAKAYMHLGYSRRRLSRDAMPEHSEILEFSKELSKLTSYKIKDESEISRVVLLER